MVFVLSFYNCAVFESKCKNIGQIYRRRNSNRGGMKSSVGSSSLHGGKVAYMPEEAKIQERGRGDRSRDKHGVGYRNRNSSTCGSEAGEREGRPLGGSPPVPLSNICYMPPPLMRVTPA